MQFLTKPLSRIEGSMRSATGVWQPGHLGTPFSSNGVKTISLSHLRHLVNIICDMKPLILILLAAVFAQGQTIADAARRERARQAQVKTTKVFTSADLKSKDSKEPAEAKPVENPAPTPAVVQAPAPPAPA